MYKDIAGLGKRIRERRVALGYKQQGFAEKIGITQTSLARYEQGKQAPSLETFIMIAEGLSISLDKLVFGDQIDVGEALRSAEMDPVFSELMALATLISGRFFHITEIKEDGTVSFRYAVLRDMFTSFSHRMVALCDKRDAISVRDFNLGVLHLMAEYVDEIHRGLARAFPKAGASELFRSEIE